MNRHGSPTFYKLLEEMADLHDRKSHDYASNNNPYGNYHFAGHVASLFNHSSKDAGFVGRLAEKIYRLANLESTRKAPKNESIDDTERDILVITALWISSRRDTRAREMSKHVHMRTVQGRISQSLDRGMERAKTKGGIRKKLPRMPLGR